MKKIISFLFFAAVLMGLSVPGAQAQEVAGTFFGQPVPMENYNFVLRTVLSFNSPWGGIPHNREELEKRIWDDLFLSYEAHRRGIAVTDEELEAKIAETLTGSSASFDRKKDPEAYAKWARDTIGVSVAVFENQMRHLVQVKKLQDQILAGIETPVTEEEAFQEFLNEYNSLSVELAEFEKIEDAQKFYEQAMADPLFWQQEADQDRQKEREARAFRQPGFVALEFLIEMWKFPKNAVYDMIEMKAGSIYPPQPIYKGYGVFRILEVRRADESLFSLKRESYFEQLRARKRYQGFRAWLEKQKSDADTQVYRDPPAGVLP
ncbi:MAG TPA: hypothetical protein PKV41_01200 [Candidatus Omnitrophota bacterium]|nr:hypothetical protein [Candidatus Omnitrophota bacterium]